MLTDLQLWLNLETNGWTAMRNSRKAKNAPKITIRRNWRVLGDAERAALGRRLRRFRRREDAIAAARAALLDAPASLGDNDANRAYARSMHALYTALLRAHLAALQLQTRRAQHVDPYASITWLANRSANLATEANNVQHTVNNFGIPVDAYQKQLWAANHPAGTPRPTPGAPAAREFTVPSAPTNVWIGAFVLGAGGQARPVVYVRQNRHGHIIDRVCIKDTRWPYHYALDTGQDTDRERVELWDPDVAIGTANHEDKRPAEIGALTWLNQCRNSQSIIRLRNWHRIYDAGRLRWYRSYLEWCAYGDLYQLSRKYTPYRDRQRKPRPVNPHEQEWLPEAFVWACLENFAVAGQLMAHGVLGVPFQRTGLKSCNHNDLKPENVFLGVNSTNIYRGYLLLKIGEFGYATMKSYDADRTLPDEAYSGLGTPHCDAPEQRGTLYGAAGIGEATNVWGLGLTIWALLHSQAARSQMYDTTPPYGHTVAKFPPQFSNDHRRVYSEQLRSLIVDCLQLSPADRPAFVQIRERIRSATDLAIPPLVDTSSGLRNALGNDPRFSSALHALRLSAEKWPMYAQLALHWSHDGAPPRPTKGPLTDVTETDETLLGGPSGRRIDQA